MISGFRSPQRGHTLSRGSFRKTFFLDNGAYGKTIKAGHEYDVPRLTLPGKQERTGLKKKGERSNGASH